MARPVTGAAFTAGGLSGPSIYDDLVAQYSKNSTRKAEAAKRVDARKQAEQQAQENRRKREIVEEFDRKSKANKANNPLLKIIDVLDTSRAALLATGAEIGNLVDLDGDGDNSFDVGRIIQRTRDNYSTGEFLSEHVGWYNDLPGWAQGAIGFTGDVLLDPLTYVSGGATAAGKIGAKEVTEEITQKVARGALERGVAERAIDDIARSGTASVLASGRHAQVAEALGYRGGIHLRAPGYNAIGRATRINRLLDRTAYGRRFGQGVQLTRGGELYQAAGRARGAAANWVRNRKPIQTLRRYANSKTGPAAVTLFDPKSTASSRFNAASASAGRGVSRRAELAFAAEFSGEMTDMLREAQRHGFDDDVFMRALQSAPTSQVVQQMTSTPKGAELLARGRTWLEGIRARINEIAGREIISEQDLYAPGVLERKFREEFGANQAVRADGKRVFAEKRRSLVPGRVLEATDDAGQVHSLTLVDPKEHPRGLSVRDQAEDFYEQVTGERYIPMFNNKAHEALPLYLNAMARVAGREEAGRFFKSVGVAIDSMVGQIGAPGATRARTVPEILFSDFIERRRIERQVAKQKAAQKANRVAKGTERHVERMSRQAADVGMAGSEQAGRQIALSSEMRQLAKETEALADVVAEATNLAASGRLAELRQIENGVENLAASLDESIQAMDRIGAEIGRLEEEKLKLASEVAEIESKAAAEFDKISDTVAKNVDAKIADIETRMAEIGHRLDDLREAVGPVMMRSTPDEIGQRIDNLYLQYDNALRRRDEALDDFARGEAEADIALIERTIEANEATLRVMRDTADIEGVRYQIASNEQELAALQAEAARIEATRATIEKLEARRASKVIDMESKAKAKIELRRAKLDEKIDQLHLDLEAAHRQRLDNQDALREARHRLRQAQKEARTDIKERLTEEIALRERAARLYDEADDIEAEALAAAQDFAATGQDLMRQTEAFEARNRALFNRIVANHDKALADEIKLGKVAKAYREFRPFSTRLSDGTLLRVKSAMDEAVAEFGKAVPWGPSTLVSADVADMMTAYAKFNTPEGMRGFLRYYDAAQNFIKRWQLASPGYLNRNYMGGKFVHWLDDIGLGAERKFRAMQALDRATDEASPLVGAVRRGRAAMYKGTKLDQLDWEAWDAWTESGLRRTGQVASEYSRNRFEPLSVNPFSRNFAVHRAVAKKSDDIEDALRGTHFTEAYRQSRLKGFDPEESRRLAFERTMKYHFDYEDLSSFESEVIKRVIPFYTWTRKAVPLMLEEIVRKPGKINNYLAAKREIENHSPLDGVVPQWMLEAGGVRLPFGSRDGAGRMYWMPDLPINSIDDYIGPSPMDTLRDTASQMTPIIKTPLELWLGEKFFKGIPFNEKPQEVPISIRAVPGLDRVLESIGWIERNADGQQVMKDRYAYTIEQYLPMLGRVRRLAPNEERYQEKALGAWLSFLGFGIRENSQSEQESELWRRYFEAKSSFDEAKELGFIDPRARMQSVDISEPPEWLLSGQIPDPAELVQESRPRRSTSAPGVGRAPAAEVVSELIRQGVIAPPGSMASR